MGFLVGKFQTDTGSTIQTSLWPENGVERNSGYDMRFFSEIFSQTWARRSGRMYGRKTQMDPISAMCSNFLLEIFNGPQIGDFKGVLVRNWDSDVLGPSAGYLVGQ